MYDRDSQPHESQPAAENPDLAGIDFGRSLTWDEARGEREVSVPLAYWPSDVALTDDFPEPIRFDAEKLILAYRGVMPLASYQRLRGLSKDLPFQLAVDRLFVVSAADRAGQGRWLACGGLSLAALVLLGVSLAALSWPSAQRHVEEVLDLEQPTPTVVDIEPADILEAVDLPEEQAEEVLLIDDQPASS